MASRDYPESMTIFLKALTSEMTEKLKTVTAQDKVDINLATAGMLMDDLWRFIERFEYTKEVEFEP
jgi:hypothetical protein